jgi:twinkle protein
MTSARRRSQPEKGVGSWNHGACPNEDCGSSDAFAWRSDEERGFCFACGQTGPIDPDEVGTPGQGPRFKKKAIMKRPMSSLTVETVEESYSPGPMPERKIRQNIAEHFGVLVDGGNHFYPYTDKSGKAVAYKHRKLPKAFEFVGDSKQIKQLFGQNVAGTGRRLFITEGEVDAMSIAQALYDKYQRFYPIISLPSASSKNLLLANREWIRSYQEVVLFLDNDEAGQEALKNTAKIIGYDKVRVVGNCPEKDANEILCGRGGAALISTIYDNKPYTPDGFVSGEELWTKYKQSKDVIAIPYPPCMPEVNAKLGGMRRGEILLLTSGTGSGKSTVVKEIILELCEYSEDYKEGVGKIGLMFLEEEPGNTVEKLIGMSLKKNLKKYATEEEEERIAFEHIFGNDRIIVADHQGSVDDSSLIDRLEYMALCGATHIVLDHITIAVSEGTDGKTGNEAVDHLMSELLKLTKRHNIWLGVVSHLRKSSSQQKPFEQGRIPSLDDIKGSGSIKQVSFDILAFARDMTHNDQKIRNTIKLRVLKARETGDTGDAGAMKYDPETTRLEPTTMDFDDLGD